MQFFYFFADSKSRAQELSNDVSFVIFGHKTWDLEGGSHLPPPSISWFSSTPAGIGLNNYNMGMTELYISTYIDWVNHLIYLFTDGHI